MRRSTPTLVAVGMVVGHAVRAASDGAPMLLYAARRERQVCGGGGGVCEKVRTEVTLAVDGTRVVDVGGGGAPVVVVVEVSSVDMVVVVVGHRRLLTQMLTTEM